MPNFAFNLRYPDEDPKEFGLDENWEWEKEE